MWPKCCVCNSWRRSQIFYFLKCFVLTQLVGIWMPSSMAGNIYIYISQGVVFTLKSSPEFNFKYINNFSCLVISSLPLKMFWTRKLWPHHKALYLLSNVDGKFDTAVPKRWGEQLWWVGKNSMMFPRNNLCLLRCYFNIDSALSKEVDVLW